MEGNRPVELKDNSAIVAKHQVNGLHLVTCARFFIADVPLGRKDAEPRPPALAQAAGKRLGLLTPVVFAA